jgi:hypothetical protein
MVTPAKAVEMLRKISAVSRTAIRVLEPTPKFFNAHLGGIKAEQRLNSDLSTLDG